MNGRDDKIHEEAAALWRQLFGAPPPDDADGASMLDMIVRGLPERDYARIATPYLRPGSIVFPKR